MVPPHDNPTFQAVSSATPNSSILGLPVSITSSASVTTAPSTHPPDTEPRKLPSWSITRLEPPGRGAEPQVSTTVASATPLPALRQSSAAFRMSSSRASIKSLLICVIASEAKQSQPRDCFDVLRTPRNDDTVSYRHISRHPSQPFFRIARMAALRRQRAAQLGHGVQIVDRPEFVDVRQEGLDTLGLGPQTLEAEQ